MIKILLEGVHPLAFKTAMEDRIKVEANVEKIVRLFIQRFKTDASACQAFGQQLQSTDKAYSTAETIISNKGEQNRHGNNNNR